MVCALDFHLGGPRLRSPPRPGCASSLLSCSSFLQDFIISSEQEAVFISSLNFPFCMPHFQFELTQRKFETIKRSVQGKFNCITVKYKFDLVHNITENRLRHASGPVQSNHPSVTLISCENNAFARSGMKWSLRILPLSPRWGVEDTTDNTEYKPRV